MATCTAASSPSAAGPRRRPERQRRPRAHPGVYDALLENPERGSPDSRHMRCVDWGGARYPSVEDALDAANLVLHLAPETNGEQSYRAFQEEEKHTGVPLADLAESSRSVRMTFGDITRQPRRILTSPCWSGNVNDGRAYAAWCLNVERLVPWRTLTGRQHFYSTIRTTSTSVSTCQPTSPAGPGQIRRRARQPGGRQEPGAELPDAPRQVAHPHDVHGQPPHAHAVTRHRAVAG